ncbi:DnaJ domain protein [Peptoniphilus sp. oral taxon 375 str. F0436]|nr:DnaJ domain protein [Peptoniphilus sp. oral taxon 375 str. F0436]
MRRHGYGGNYRISRYKKEEGGACKAKKTLEDLLLERDNLLYITCENIKTAYMLTFGSLEYKLYQAYCQYLRLRRKKDLIQVKKNRQEKVKIEVIEAQLDEEFQDYKEKLDEKMDQINQALKRSKGDYLSEKETIRIKKLYKAIVKRLHPDLNPDLTEGERELFVHATEAYKDGDLAKIEIIFSIVDSGESKDELTSSNADLEKEVQRMEGLVRKIQEEIDLIKENPPYSWKVYLEDEEKKAEKLEELKEDLENFKTAIRTQEEYIRDLMEDKDE